MKKINSLILILALSSCNQYLGKVEPDYTPTKEVNEVFSKVQNNYSSSEVYFGDIIYPKVINPSLRLNNNLKINKIINTDRNTVVSFMSDSIILSKDKNIHVIDNQNEDNNFDYKLNLTKDEKVLYVFEHRGKIFILTNRSSIFAIDNQNVINLADFDVFTYKTPIVLDDSLIIFSVFGEIYEIKLDNFSILKKNNFNPNPGISAKSNLFEDQANLYYLFNTNTLITFDKNNYEYFNNYILEDLNILSSLGVFNELVDSPFSYNGYLYFLDRSGKIAVFKPDSSDILWEIDINETILSYLFSNDGYLILMTFDKILILSNNGNIINTYNHNKETPISIFNIQKNIYLISDEGISKINLDIKSEVSFYKNKFSSNLDIYYQDQNIYLKDDKSLFKLSE